MIRAYSSIQAVQAMGTTSDTIKKYFYKVGLSQEKRDFLFNIDWKYIYTLNIDDAIENNSKYKPVYPYDKNLSDESRNYRPVYKLHGDVFYELTHETERLVFRKASYLASIESNRRMLELLEEDMIGKNILFIGCALTDEDDIAFSVAFKNIINKKETRRIIFANKKPGVVKSNKLKRHGVNTIILFDLGHYEQIYALIMNAYLESANLNIGLDRYTLKLECLTNDPEANKSYLIAGVTDIGAASSGGKAVLPYYYGCRNIEDKIIKLVSENGLAVMSGPRVSGRTLLARAICNRVRNRKVMYIQSGVMLEHSYACKLMGLRNVLIVFDSKSVDVALARILRDKEDLLRENASSVIVIIDENDGLIIDALSYSKLEFPPVLELGRVFKGAELKDANEKLKSVRCPTFRSGKKLLDNIFHAYHALGEDKVIKHITKSPELLKALYLLGIKKKFDGDWVRFLDASHKDVEELVGPLVPYLEYEKIGITELASHAGYRIICNSDAWLLAVLAEMYRTRGVAWCCERLFELVRNVSRRDRRLAIECTLFDNLNAVFGNEVGGAAELILEFYDRLEMLWGKEPEFFVQKAKAYYNMYRSEDVANVLGVRLNELAVAASWAENDHNSSAERNIRHICALVSLRRVFEEKYQHVDNVVDAIEKTWFAIDNEEFNSDYVKKLAEGKIHGSRYLRGLMDAVDKGGVADIEILEVKDLLGEIRGRIGL